MNYINIPGLNNSGPNHWQTLWEDAFPQHFTRVQQNNWAAPVKKEWVEAVHTTLMPYDSPVVLVAHSLGCITAAHWANENKSPIIAGALLVAPADAEQSNRECFKTFCPVPKNKLRFPSIVVASINDPYIAIEKAAKYAAYWGSKFVCVGNKGHINAQSGLNQWDEGLSLLASFSFSHKKPVSLK